jgi:hypothetical protein
MITRGSYRNLRAAKLISFVGLVLVVIAATIVVINLWTSMELRAEKYRITSSLLFFLLSTAISILGRSAGVAACLFLLSICPTFSTQFQAFTGYGRIQPQVDIGLAIVCGTLIGICLNLSFKRAFSRRSPLVVIPWPAGLLLIFITLSCIIAVLRNLSQTQSSLTIDGVLVSISHYELLDWFNDFRPIRDWLAYSIAILLLGIMLPVLQKTPNRNRLVFFPIAFGILISATVGIVQSQTGIGLLDWQVVFRRDGLGSMAIGLQPDIHAFAAQMMLGSVGLLGFIARDAGKKLGLFIFLTLTPVAVVGIILSKSKASIPLTIFFTIVLLTCWLTRRRLSTINLVVFFSALLASLLGIIALAPIYFGQLTFSTPQNFVLPSFEVFNEWLSYRPEIYFAALLMFLNFPLLGVGQGNFYRLSADDSFSQSQFLAVTQNGENAHNYFFQTIAETGSIGLVVFTIFLAYPFVVCRDRKILISASIAIGAIFLGNILSHSLLVRENLIIMSAILAILYSHATTRDAQPVHHNAVLAYEATRKSSLPTTLACILSSCVLVVAGREFYMSFRTKPFTEDRQCYRRDSLTEDGWTSGLFTKNLAKNAIGIEFAVEMVQPDLLRHPLTARLELLASGKSIVEKQINLNDRSALEKFTLTIPSYLDYTIDRHLTARLTLNRCFIPSNYGGTLDTRRLGIKIRATDVY